MNDKQKPSIRFKGFTEAWEQRKLGEFGKATGGTSIESEFDELGKYKVISIGSYSEASKYTDQGIRVNKTNKTESRILNKNDLTMILNDKTASGNIIGRVLLIDADDSYVFNQRTERIEVYKNEFLPEFLYQLLNADNIREKIIRASQGNTQIYVNWTSISELSYEIPLSKHEQRKIADLFNQLDNLITLHQRKYDKLVNVKKSMLEKMFPRDGKNVPEIRFSGFAEAWEQRKFDEVFDCTIPNNTLSRAELNYESGSVRNIHYGDILIKYGSVVDVQNDEIPFATGKSSDDFKGALLQDGDIIIADTAEDETTGKACEIGNSQGLDVVSGLHTMVCRPRDKMALGYLGYYLNSDAYHHQLLPLMQGIKVLSLSRTNVQKTMVCYPKSNAEQQLIADCFRNLDKLITLHQREVEKLQNIKKSCLEKMFA